MPSQHTKKTYQLLVPRIAMLVCLDILVINLSAFLALFIRYEFDFATMQLGGFLETMNQWAIPNTVMVLILFALLRLYNSLWGFAGADELLHIFIATVLAAAVQFVFIYTETVALPRSFPVLFAMLLFVATTLVRFSYRFARRLRIRLSQTAQQRTMLIGAGQAGALVLREFKSSHFSRNKVVCIIDDDPGKKGRRDEFCFEGGLSDFVRYLNSESTPLYDTPIHIGGKSGDILVDLAIQHNDGYNENLFSYVNNIPTSEGGTHETGFKAAFTKCMNDYCRRTGILKDKDPSLAGEDFREGLTVVLSVKMRNIQFEGQTKTKLGNTEARPAVEAVVTQELSKYLEDIKNAATGNIIADKAIKASKARAAARKAKENAREKNKLENAPLVGKLSSCTGRNYAINELFIVEGDSAGGSAKQGRDRRFQAILPLRGKPLNVEKKRLEQVLQNEEFRSIITALGTGIGEDFDINSLKYDKVIILADADQDGAHIRAILLTFFYRYMRELINQGHVYIGMAPLYRVQKKDAKPIYCYDDPALKQALKTVGKNYTLQRYKGLGEMNPEQLWETTMDPAARRLTRVHIEDAADVEHLVTVLMGDKVQSRKEYIFSYADFNKDKTAFEKLRERQ